MTAPKPPDWPGPDELEKPSVAKLLAKKRELAHDPIGLPMARIKPYTGIAGFTTAAEVRSVAADATIISCFDTPHFGYRRLAIGVLASWKTLNGGTPDQPERYPPIGRLREIIDAAAEPYHHYSPALGQGEDEGTVFDLKSRCLRLIHYNSREPNLLAQLDRLCEIAGPNLDGFQLNMAWPPEDDLKHWAMEHPTMRVVLQINREMFSNVARTPQLLVNEIGKKYLPSCITDVLFDMSGGTGQKIDLAEAGTVLEALYGAFKDQVGIGLAGGLDASSVWDLKPLFAKWPDLSIDAEGRIRDVYRDPNDKTNVLADVLGEAAREYARRAFGVMPLRAKLEY